MQEVTCKFVKHLITSKLRLVFLILVICSSGNVYGQQFWKTDGTTGTWTGLNWGTSASGPFGTAWTSTSNAAFTANSTLTFATTSVGNVSVSNGITVTVTAGGTLTLGGVRTFDVGTGSTLTWASQSWSTAAGNAGAGIIKNGTGILDLGAISNQTQFTGGFTLNSGTVIVSGNASLGLASLSLNGGTIQSSGTRAFSTTSINIGSDFALSGTGNANWDSATTIALGTSTRTITNNTTSGSRQFRGLISGSSGAGLTFAGTGGAQIYIGNTGNTFDGPVAINGGEVVFNGDGTLGNTTSITLDGGRLTMASMNTAGTTSALTSASIGTSRSIFIGASTGTSISVQGATGVLTYNGVIADKPSTTGSWAKQGAGILSLGGASTYTGDTAINNGTLQLTTDNDRLPIGTTVSLGQSASANLGTFDLNGRNQQIAGLNSILGTNALTNKNTVTSTTSSILTLGGNGSYVYGAGTAANSGIIGGSISIVKTGSGSQTLGDVNTYTGSTQINNGKLIIASTGSINSTSGVTINGATAEFNYNGSTAFSQPLTLTQGKISGSGAINTAITIGSNVTVSPGNSPGIQAYSAGMTLNNGGTYQWEINNWTATPTAGVDHDQIQVSGANLNISTITSGGFKIAITGLTGTNAVGAVPGFDNSVARTWTIITSTGVTGTFDAANFTLDTSSFASSNDLGGGAFSLALNSSNLELSFTPVPEPTTVFGMTAMGLGLLGGLRRLRRKTA